jgi:protein arginine N-methyltransferase 5
MDNYGAADDPGVTFCIGHHEPNRTLSVTPQVVNWAHESNVSSLAFLLLSIAFSVADLMSNYSMIC